MNDSEAFRATFTIGLLIVTIGAILYGVPNFFGIKFFWKKRKRMYDCARSITKCNIFRRQCCMGKIYEQLSIEERTMIQMQLEMGIKPAAIAVELNRSASTLSRELRRNGWVRPKARRGPGRPSVAGGYRAETAHRRAQACTVTPRVARRLRPGTALWKHVLRYPKAGLLARADCWHTGAGARRNAVVAGFSRNHLHRDLRHAAWRAAHGRDWLVALRPHQTPSPGARRGPAREDTGHGQHS